MVDCIRCTDAEKCIKDYLKELIDEGKDNVEITEFNAEIQKRLAEVSAADVVEVVRCGKCKCYEEMHSENARFCNRFGGYVTEHDYCSRAEKERRC